MDKEKAINCIQDLIDVANSHGSACIYKRNDTLAELENVLDCLRGSEPVVHAHWERNYPGFPRCSRCHWETGEDNIEWGIGKFNPPRYCENCGAKMDEEEVHYAAD